MKNAAILALGALVLAGCGVSQVQLQALKYNQPIALEEEGKEAEANPQKVLIWGKATGKVLSSDSAPLTLNVNGRTWEIPYVLTEYKRDGSFYFCFKLPGDAVKPGQGDVNATLTLAGECGFPWRLACAMTQVADRGSDPDLAVIRGDEMGEKPQPKKDEGPEKMDPPKKDDGTPKKPDSTNPKAEDKSIPGKKKDDN